MGRLLLWDIDGTLLTSGSVSRRALFNAAAEILGHPVEAEIDAAGKTDPAIVTDLLVALGIEEADRAGLNKKILRCFGPHMAELRSEIAPSGRLFDGVRPILRALDDTRSVTTVLTGNIAVNAICKLDAFRLTQHFDLEIGAFGSDRAIRYELVDVAVERAAILRNKYFADDEIWIIGDTPHDLAAARANNIRCLLVATGKHPFDELADLAPDAVMHDLTNTEEVLALLTEST